MVEGHHYPPLYLHHIFAGGKLLFKIMLSIRETSVKLLHKKWQVRRRLLLVACLKKVGAFTKAGMYVCF